MKFVTTVIAISLAVAVLDVSAQSDIFLVARLVSPLPEENSNFGQLIVESYEGIMVAQPNASFNGTDSVGAVFFYGYEQYLLAPLEFRPMHSYPLARFGSSMATSAGELVIGAPGGSDQQVDTAPRGVVEAWESVGSSWSREQMLAPPEGAVGDNFGYSVSADGVSLLVGYPGEVGGSQGLGSALDFRRTAGGWVYDSTQYSPLSGDTGFGKTVKLAGATHHVGAPAFVDPDGSTGADVYFFGGQPGEMIAPDGSEAREFAGSGILIGSTLLFGVPYPVAEDGSLLPGRVYAFTSGAVSGYKLSTIVTAPDGHPGDGFGTSIDEWGITFAIGAPGQTINGLEGAGAVWLMNEQGGKFLPRERKISSRPGRNSHFGQSITWTYGRLAVGAPGENVGDIEGAGAAYVYHIDHDWIFKGSFDFE